MGHIGITSPSWSLHTFITDFCRKMEEIPTMRPKRIRWETMDKNQIPPYRLAEQYFITCTTEGKTPFTLRG